jgi:hypothetical protein
MGVAGSRSTTEGLWTVATGSGSDCIRSAHRLRQPVASLDRYGHGVTNEMVAAQWPSPEETWNAVERKYQSATDRMQSVGA